MKAICRYTGLDLLSSSGFARWCVISEHPIFSVPLEDTIQLAAVEWSPEMFILDKKLLLLSIAKNCELITWETNRDEIIPALPSIGTIESSIASLLQIAGWVDFQRSISKFSSYPSLRISEDTQDMRSFPSMLTEIINSRDYTEKMERREHRLVCLEANAKNLSAKCRIGANREMALLSTTAEWALMVTEEHLNAERVDSTIRSDWKKMLMTSATQLRAKGFSINDVEELRDFMVDYLPHGSVIAHDVIAHLHRLVAVNSFSDIDGGTILSARILTSGTLTASSSEPHRSEFANLVEYARARARWILVQSQQQETAKQLDRVNKDLAAKQRRESDDVNDI